MNRYKVTCNCLYWYVNQYIVEAESEDDITEDLILSEGDLIASDVDTLDQVNSIDEIELINDED